jgi:hypothetical protein
MSSYPDDVDVVLCGCWIRHMLRCRLAGAVRTLTTRARRTFPGLLTALVLTAATLTALHATTRPAATRTTTKPAVHCVQPHAVPGQAIKVDGYGNGQFAPVRSANYVCDAAGRWSATGIPVT